MTTSRRESLVRIARKFDALIVCDDVYDFLGWDLQDVKSIPSPFQRLVDIDRTLDGGPSDCFGNVVSNGTFSKLIGPGCRVGWAEGTAKFAYGLSQAYVLQCGPLKLQISSFMKGNIETLIELNPRLTKNILLGAKIFPAVHHASSCRLLSMSFSRVR